MADQKPRPAPDFWPELGPVREAFREGALTIGRCTQCAEPHAWPRALCPFCLAPAEFERASGEGEIYSFSVMRRGPQASVIAYVTLREGPCVMARIHAENPDELAIGQAVVFSPDQNEGGDLAPRFIPISTTERRQ